MQFRNTSKSPIENTPPGGVGFIDDAAFARHLESIGYIEALDRKAIPSLALSEATVSKLSLENLTLLKQLELGKVENAALKKELLETNALKDALAAARKSGPPEGTKADKAAVAKLSEENAKLVEAAKVDAELIAALEADLSKLTAPATR